MPGLNEGGTRSWQDPKAVTDLAVTRALGGDCLADAAMVRAKPGIYGRVASDVTISRSISVLANDTPTGC